MDFVHRPDFFRPRGREENIYTVEPIRKSQPYFTGLSQIIQVRSF
jgi:hypothetical protein